MQIRNLDGDVLTEVQADSLRNANLRDANLRYANLRDADLRDADLRDANLRYASLRGADLRGADLSGAYLRDANLRYADLRYADLRYTNLRYANLRGADLRGADLSGADLSGADLRDADLSRAAFKHTKRNGCTWNSPPVQMDFWYGYPTLIHESGMEIGCKALTYKEWFSTDELDTAIAQDIDKDDFELWLQWRDALKAVAVAAGFYTP